MNSKIINISLSVGMIAMVTIPVGWAVDWNGDPNRFGGDVIVGYGSNPANLTVYGKNNGSSIFNVGVLNGSTFLYMTNAGNLGIGTTAPAYKLDVNGDFRASGSIYANGNVGIGTIAPAHKLEVVGHIRATGAIIAAGGGGIFGIARRDTNAVAWGIYSQNGEFSIYDYVNATNRFSMKADGQVAMGLGVSSHASGQTVVGKYNNTETNDATTTPPTDHTQGVFVVGAGTASTTANRKNALRVLEDGTVLVNPGGDVLMGNFKQGPKP